MITSRARLLTHALIAILAIAIGVLAIGAGGSPAAGTTSRKPNGHSDAASRPNGRKCSAAHPARGRVRGHPSRVRRCVKKLKKRTHSTSPGGGSSVSGDPTGAGIVEGDPAGAHAAGG